MRILQYESQSLRRTAIAASIAIAAGVISFLLIGRPDYPSDFFHFWAGARTVLHGGNPYLLPPPGPMNPEGEASLYPLPALLLLAPIAWLPLGLAGGLFMGLSSGALAFGVMGRARHLMPMFLSAPFILSLSLGQWSPLMVAGFLIPALAIVFPAKPNLGLPLWIAAPNVRAIAAGALIIIASLVIMPRWPLDWARMITNREEKFIPVLRPFGVLLLLAAAGWRTREGRLLLVMSLVPQALFFYDQLPLWLVARTLRQSLVLSLYSVIAFVVWWRSLAPDDYYVRRAIPYAQSLYFLALGIVLWNLVRDRRTMRPATDSASSQSLPADATG